MDFRNVAGTRNPEDSVTRRWLPAGQRCHCCRCCERDTESYRASIQRNREGPFQGARNKWALCRVPATDDPFSGCRKRMSPLQGARDSVTKETNAQVRCQKRKQKTSGNVSEVNRYIVRCHCQNTSVNSVAGKNAWCFCQLQKMLPTVRCCQ